MRMALVVGHAKVSGVLNGSERRDGRRKLSTTEDTADTERLRTSKSDSSSMSSVSSVVESFLC
jgi:hypothetical protein